MKELTREEALRLHRQMWSDMQKDFGDTPTLNIRNLYKKYWCETHGFENIMGNCFLCEYVENHRLDCKHCPIEWPGPHCGCGDITYHRSPISKILALPEREIKCENIE